MVIGGSECIKNIRVGRVNKSPFHTPSFLNRTPLTNDSSVNLEMNWVTMQCVYVCVYVSAVILTSKCFQLHTYMPNWPVVFNVKRSIQLATLVYVCMCMCVYLSPKRQAPVFMKNGQLSTVLSLPGRIGGANGLCHGPSPWNTPNTRFWVKCHKWVIFFLIHLTPCRLFLLFCLLAGGDNTKSYSYKGGGGTIAI